MVMRELRRFEFTCDGYYPDGRPCPCDMRVEAYSPECAEQQARSFGWYQDHRGWICNAGGGHRDDRRQR